MKVDYQTYFSKEPILHAGVYVSPQALVSGDVTLHSDVSVWPMTVIRGDVNRIEIGQNTNVQDNSVLHVTHAGPFTDDGQPLIIGSGITIGHRVILHACTVQDNSLIGMGAIVMDAAVVESNVIVAAGSLVPPKKRLRSGHLYLGNPVKEVRRLSTKEIEHIEYSAEHYKTLKNQYLKQLA